MLPFTPEGLLPIRMQQGIRIPQKFINRKNLNIAIPIHAMGIHTNRKQGDQGSAHEHIRFHGGAKRSARGRGDMAALGEWRAGDTHPRSTEAKTRAARRGCGFD
jgi:hypothetical protein